MAMKQEIEKILAIYKKKKISSENLKSSAVLMPLFYNKGQYHVLFTKRSDELNSHKGQVCFPGGTQQPGDLSLLQTALREAEEEIGLKAKDVEILGELDDCGTRGTGYIISPFVAFIPHPYPFKLNRNEVEQIFSVPLSALMDEANFSPNYYPAEYKSVRCHSEWSEAISYAYEYEGHIIWGATARILKQFTELLRKEE
jgi:8-oxo-dGTP pyrophosphatase MutT (NUDIX family)